MRARQWSRTAFAIAALLTTLPLVSRIFLGAWDFQEAFGLAALCALTGLYFEILARRRWRALPDPASYLDAAIQAAQAGRPEKAIHLLDAAIAASPRLWQAYQYRAQIRLALGETERALGDLDRAIILAPEEAGLRELREAATATPESRSPA